MNIRYYKLSSYASGKMPFIYKVVDCNLIYVWADRMWKRIFTEGDGIRDFNNMFKNKPDSWLTQAQAFLEIL